MVAGGVGLAPFATLAEALAARGTPTTLFYGARSGQELFYLEFFERLGVTLVLATEDGSAGRARARHRAARAGARTAASAGSRHGLRLRARNRCSPPWPASPRGTVSRCEVSVERVMGCGLGGCYSCVVPVRHDGEPPHFVRSCIGGPVFDGADIVWD